MKKRPFKLYYLYETKGVSETQFCCSTMKDFWKLGIIFFDSEDLTIISKEGIFFKYCSYCGGKIIIKESRL